MINKNKTNREYYHDEKIDYEFIINRMHALPSDAYCLKVRVPSMYLNHEFVLQICTEFDELNKAIKRWEDMKYCDWCFYVKERTGFYPR